MNNAVSASAQRGCSIILGSPFNHNVEVAIKALIVPKIADSIPSKSLPASCFSELPSFQLADPQFFHSAKIDILIGGDFYPSVMLSDSKNDVCESLRLRKPSSDGFLRDRLQIVHKHRIL